MTTDKTPATHQAPDDVTMDSAAQSRRAMLGRVAKWTPPVMMTLITPARADGLGSPPPGPS